MDSGSTDDTARVATEAGATVHHRDEVLPEVGSRPGKGEVLWKSLAVTTGDVVVFVDADLVDPQPQLVTGLLGGFTTFSAFSAESLILLQRGEFLLALAHAMAHVVGALACAALGFRIAQAVLAH